MPRKRSVVLALLVGLSGCSSDLAKTGSFNSSCRVTVYSGGAAARTFTSRGPVMNEEKSDGWYFMATSSAKLIRVTGTVVIEEL